MGRELEEWLVNIDMRAFAAGAGTNVRFHPGNLVFKEGDQAGSMYVIQSGTVEILLGDKVVSVCGPNEAIGFMSVIDGEHRTSTARVRDEAELSIIDQKKFRFMVDEVPNFALYVMDAMARRIRGLTAAI